MPRLQIPFTDGELRRLRSLSRSSGKSIGTLVRLALRKVGVRPAGENRPVALWKGKAKREAVDHDSIYDQPE